MIARPPPSYEWTLHPGLTDYGAVYTLLVTKKRRGCIRNPRGVNFYLVGFRIQPRLFFATRSKKRRGCIRNPRGVNFYLVGFRIQPRDSCPGGLEIHLESSWSIFIIELPHANERL